MKRPFIFILLFTCFLLSGCFETFKGNKPIEVKYTVVKPNASQVKDCSVSAPPSVAYATSSVADKEAILYNYSSSLLDDLTKCNSQWQSLRDWFIKQDAIYTDKKP